MRTSTVETQVTRLAKGGTLNLAGSVVGGVCSLALVLVVTNGFDQRTAGLLFAATSLFLITTALCELGADAGLSYTVQRALAAGRPDRARRVLWIALVPVATLSVLLAALGWVVTGWLATTVLGGGGADGGDAAAMLRILATVLPVATAYSVVLAATRAYGTMRPNVLVEKVGRLPLQIVLVLAVGLFGAGPVVLAMAWALPYVVGLAMAALALRSLWRRHDEHPDGEQSGDDTSRPDETDDRPGEVREFWAFTAPRAAGRVCQVALQRADVVLVAALLGPRSAALYTAVTKVVSAGQLLTLGVQQVLQPQLSRLFAAEDTAGARDLFRTATAWLMSLAWPFYLTAAIAAPWVLGLFGEQYGGRGAQVSAVVLALTMLVATACGPVDTALLMAGRSRQSLGNAVAALVVNLVLIGLLVPPLGVVGAALAWSAALVVRNLLPVVQVWRGLGLFAFGPAAQRVALIAIALFGVLPLGGVLAFGPFRSPLAALVPFLVICGMYAGMVWRNRALLELRAFEPMVRTLLKSILAGLRGLPRRVRRLPAGLLRASTRMVTRLPLPHRVRVLLSTLLLRRLRPARVPMHKLLLGAQDGMSAQRYAGAFDDLMWGSTPVAEGPHAALLAAAERGPLSDEAILESPYGEHARRCLLLTGRYFWATDDAGIVEVARSFLSRGAARDPGTWAGDGATRGSTSASAGATASSEGAATHDTDRSDGVGRTRTLVASPTEASSEPSVEASAGTLVASAEGAEGDGFADAPANGNADRPANGPGERPAGTSGPGDPVLVAPIADSDCFSVLDGHHRLALAAHRGERVATVTVKRAPVSTPLQDLLDQMSWIGGKRELYQPLDAPELRSGWTTVRRCTDRLDKMRFFLTSRGLARTEYRKPSYLDVACCYGWFVARMGEQGFVAEGLERDPLGRRLAAAAYGVEPDRIHVGDAGEQLRAWGEAGRRWDVVSCFSLLHHFVLGRGDGVSAEDLVGLLSDATRGVLFLDTGQQHETWFARSLAGWSAERVADFLSEHGDFGEVVDLGPDEDAVGPYQDNYGRSLFACVK